MINSKTQRIYEFIQRYHSSNHVSPTMEEIGKQVGLSSPASVHAHVVELEKEGLITRKRKAWRCIQLPLEQ